MEVRGLRRTHRPSPVAGVELVGSLAEVVDGADHVVVAAPLTPATRHLIDAAALAAMKPGVHLVNIARGGLVDQDALRVALDDGTVALASLDAVDPEPLPEGHWLFSHPQGAAQRPRLVELAGRHRRPCSSASRPTCAAWLDGGPLPDRVDLAQGY